ncbi:MAG: glycerophosphodiester phosphodiesterase [Peptococcaceae bacterium]|nr:glycerophosphodiester phosphodiesterase [Peptococcaceae bacterium]
MTILFILLIIALVFVLLVKGRTGHKDLPALRNWYYAHRGLHSADVPENSLEAFSAAKAAGYGIELDIHLMQDGELAVIHDSSLKRVADADVTIEELSALDLNNYFLEGTQAHIPLFTQVLELIDGEVPLIVELKATTDNYPKLCEKACDLLENYNGLYCMESFDPRCIAWLRKHRPDIMRGQLTQDFFKSKVKYSWLLRFAMKHNLYNLISQPDFIAYRFEDRKTLSNFVVRKIWGVQGVAWTIRSKQDFDTALKENWIPIFENFTP